jgi:hypothetical protein
MQKIRDEKTCDIFTPKEFFKNWRLNQRVTFLEYSNLSKRGGGISVKNIAETANVG